MRFNQLKTSPDAIVRKKLYKKGKAWVVASMITFAGMMLLNTTPVKATTVNGSQTTNTQQSIVSDQSNSDDSATTDEPSTNNAQTKSDATDINEDDSSYIYQGNNIKQNDDGTLTASVTYQGQNYDVTGKEGSTVRKTDASGNAVNINISTTKQQKYTDPTGSDTVDLSGPADFVYKAYNHYGQKGTTGFAGDESQNIDAQMTDYNGNTYYHVIGDADEWIQQNTGVTANGDLTLATETVTTPIFVINDPTLDNGKAKTTTQKVDTKTGVVTGTVVVHSDYYNKDLTYSYSGKAGEIVKATLDGNDGSMVTPRVSVKIQSYSGETQLDDGYTVSLAGPADFVYGLITKDGRQASRGLAGDSAWETDKYVFINNVVYYRVSLDEWLKQSTGVEYDDGSVVNNTTETDYSVTPYVEPLVVGDVSINSNLDKKQVAKGISGFAGDDVTVKVPDVNGYTKNKDSVIAHINADGTITTKELVIYKKADSGNSGNTSNNNSESNESLDFVKKDQDVSTLVGKGNVTLYKLSGTEFTPVTTRALAENSDWYSDQYVNVNGMTYFRVATNEWVRISNVYRYKNFNVVATTKNQITRLLNDEGTLVTNRALGPRTSWLVDRIGYLGNDDDATEFYRVATNEFLNISDVI